MTSGCWTSAAGAATTSSFGANTLKTGSSGGLLALTLSGSFSSLTCTEWPISRWLTSTVISSGRSRGKQATRIVAKHRLEQAATVLHANRLARARHRHFRVQNLVLRDLMQVHMHHVILQRIMLNILQQREMLVDLLALGIDQLDINE